jgi:hypothetical protein
VKRRARSGAAGTAATSASPRLIRRRRDRRVAATASRAGHPRRHQHHPNQLLLAQHLHALQRHCGCGGGSSIGSPFPLLCARSELARDAVTYQFHPLGIADTCSIQSRHRWLPVPRCSQNFRPVLHPWRQVWDRVLRCG